MSKTKFTIGIDANEANISNRVGSNVYAYQILKYLSENKSEDFDFRIYLKSSPQKDFPPNLDYQVFGPSPLWTQFALPKKLYSQKLAGKSPDLFFTLGHYAPRFSPVPTIISIMDLAFLKFPNEFLKKDLEKLTKWTKYSAQNAKHIFTISDSSKKDIIKTYNIPEDRITVTHLGIDINQQKTDQDKSFQLLAKHFAIHKPYIIYVGTLQPRKNISRLIEAFGQIKSNSKLSDFQLVLVGKKGWLYNEIYQKVKDLKLEKDVIFTGFVSDYEKNELIKNAHTFVLPSLYEGFGIPVLEAMNLEIPVLVSHNSSLTEVGGDAISYINSPESVDNIAKNLTQMLQFNKDKRLEIIASQKKQAAKFSWQNCGQQTLEKLTELINK